MKSKPRYSRWSNWENAVLARCGNLPKLQATISERRREINNDAQETETLRELICEYVRLSGEDPMTAHVMIRVNELFGFLRAKYPNSISGVNKVKGFIDRHHVPEIVDHKKISAGAVFVFRGASAEPDAKLRHLRGRRED